MGKVIRGVIRIAQNKVVKWTILLLWMMFIFSMSHLDSVKSWYLTGKTLTVVQQDSSEIKDLDYQEEMTYFNNKEDKMLFVRKLAHVVEYFILVMLLMNALWIKGELIAVMIKSSIFSFIFAVLDEIHQLYVPGRTGSIGDVMIDSFGILIGIICVGSLIIISNSYVKGVRHDQ